MAAIDFDELYAPKAVSAWRLPFASSVDPTSGLVQGLRLVWSKLPKASAAADAAPFRFVCCDVLVIDRDGLIDQPTFVFARRIEIESKAILALDRSRGPDNDLTLFAQQIVDARSGAAKALQVTTVIEKPGADPQEVNYSFQPDGGPGASGMVWEPRAEAAKPVATKDLDPGHLLVGEPLWLALTTTFQVATLLSTERPEVSIAQLRWIMALAQANPDTRQLAGQARTMAIDLKNAAALGSNTVLVPRLDAEIWAAEAQAMFNLLRDRNATWGNLLDRIHTDKNWAADAAVKLAETANQDDLSQKLEDQAAGTRDQAMRALSVAIGQMVYARLQMRFRELDFAVGILKWKEDKTLGEIFNLVLGVFKLLEQIPAIVAVGPELAVLPAVEFMRGLGESVVTGSMQVFDKLKRPGKGDAAGNELPRDWLAVEDVGQVGFDPLGSSRRGRTSWLQ